MKRIIHYVTSESVFYIKRYKTFAHDRLSSWEHIFAARQKPNDPRIDNHSFHFITKTFLAVIAIRRLRSVHRIAKRANAVVIHGLSFSMLEYAYIRFLWEKSLFQKAVWIVWGGDVYYFRDRPRGWKGRLTEGLRKKTIPKIRHIAGIPGDIECVQEVYGWIGCRYLVTYPTPTSYSISDRKPTAPLDHVHLPVVMVGNSASRNNRHFEALRELSKFQRNQFYVFCPLAHNGPKKYVESVVQFGKSLFGEFFIYMDSTVSFDEFKKVLLSVDYAIFAHNRQQGVGTALFLLWAGKRLYLREGTTSFRYLKELGLDVMSTDQFFGRDPNEKKLPFEPVKRPDVQRELIETHFGDESISRNWEYMLSMVSDCSHMDCDHQ